MLKEVFFKVISLILSIVCFISISANVYAFFIIQDRDQQSQKQINDLRNTLTSQKKLQQDQKNTIRDLWEKQSANNDQLIAGQQKYIDDVNAYVAQTKKTVKFVSGIPQILPTADEDKLLTSEKKITTEQQSLDQATNLVAAEKQKNTDIINALYLDSGENQVNRANPN